MGWMNLSIRGWPLAIVVAISAVTTSAATMSASAAEPKTLLLVSQSPDGHPRGTHEYKAGVELLARLLESNRELKVRIANGDEPWTEGPELIAQADGVVIFVSEGARWLQAAPRRYEAFERLRARGGGLVALHWAMGTRRQSRSSRFSNSSAAATEEPIGSTRSSIRCCTSRTANTRSPMDWKTFAFTTSSTTS